MARRKGILTSRQLRENRRRECAYHGPKRVTIIKDWRRPWQEKTARTYPTPTSDLEAEVQRAVIRGNTERFLEELAKYRVQRVAIACSTPLVPASVRDDPWHDAHIWPNCYVGQHRDGWTEPAIWIAAEAAGIYGGCGSVAQAQVYNVIAGAFYRKGKRWVRGEVVKYARAAVQDPTFLP